MLIVLLVGTLLAAGHHLFVHNLDEGKVPTGDGCLPGSSWEREDSIISIGTAFGFPDKASFVLSISDATV